MQAVVFATSGTPVQLKKVPVDGGVPVVVAEGVVSPLSTWTENGDIVSALTFDGLYRIPAGGGSPGLIFPGSSMLPFSLPGGRSILLSEGQLCYRFCRSKAEK